jgi:hypothetical protein
MTNVCGTSGRIRSRGGGFTVLAGVSVALGLWMLAPGVLAGRTDNLHTESPAAPRRWTINYRLKSAGQVSLAVYDARGRLVRTLLQGQKQWSGEHRVEWDGLDRNGNPMPPGQYTWKLLSTPGLEAKFVTVLGVHPEMKPWHEWVGNHSAPTAVAADEEAMYVGGAVNESVPAVIKQSLDGQTRHWEHESYEPWMGAGAMAVAGNRLYLLQQNMKIVVVDAGTGKKLGMWDVLWPGDGRPGPDDPLLSMDLDAKGKTIVLSYRDHNALRWLDAVDGKVLTEARIDEPLGVAVGSGQTVYVITGGQVKAVTPKGESTTVVEAEHLTRPFRLSLGRESGHLLVAEAAPSHQVKPFSLDGKLIRRYGRAGGRAFGPYIPSDFRYLKDITADGRGGFLVAEIGTRDDLGKIRYDLTHEGTLRRVAHVDRSGAVIDQWYGGMPYYHTATPDPADPTRVFFAGPRVKALAKVNYETGDWRVVAEFAHPNFEELFPRTTGPYAHWQAVRRHGRLYLANMMPNAPALFRVDEVAGRLIPVAVAGTTRPTHSSVWQEAIRTHGYPDPEAAPQLWTWSDQNGDGDFQSSEFTFATDVELHWGGARQMDIDAELNVFLPNTYPERNGAVGWFVLPNTAPPEAEIPQWDWKNVRPAAAKFPAELRDLLAEGARTNAEALWRDGEEALYQIMYSNKNPGDDRHGGYWPSDGVGNTRLVKYDSSGRVEWSVGRHDTKSPDEIVTPFEPGLMHLPIRLLGKTHGAIILADKVVHPAMAWTEDGLYAGSFLDRRADDGLPGMFYTWWRDPAYANDPMHDSPIPYDCLVGGAIHELENGEVLWFTQGYQGTPIYRIRGWQDWSRQSGTIEMDHAPLHAKATGTGLRAEYFGNPDLRGEPVTRRVDDRIWFEQDKQRRAYGDWPTPVADGQLDRKNFSVRWNGMVEAPLTEAFTFSTYVQHESGVRLWVNNRLVIDSWETRKGHRWMSWRGWGEVDPVRKMESTPISLQAGRRYRLRLEFVSRTAEPSVSLNWDSFSWERQRIPKRFLYSEDK